MTTLTMHTLESRGKQRAALLTSHFGKLRTRDQTVPRVNTVINIDPLLVVFTDEQGKPKTPMTKARFNSKTSRWEQVSPSQAGLLMFFTDVHAPDDCTKVRIVRVIPNGRACYVEPA